MIEDEYISQNQVAKLLRRAFNLKMEREIMEHFAVQEVLINFERKRTEYMGIPGHILTSSDRKFGYLFFYHIKDEDNIPRFISKLEELKEMHVLSGKKITGEFAEKGKHSRTILPCNLYCGFAWRVQQ